MKNPFNKTRFRIHHLKNFFNKDDAPAWQKKKNIFLGLLAVVFAVGSGMFFFVLLTLPSIDNVTKLVAAQSSQILDRNGNLLYAIHGDENRKIVPYDQISPYAPKAVMAIEDDKFYQHSGIDMGAILKAICSQMHICSQARGGSTITQQFVKNAFLSSERTYTRKLKEIILSLQIEGRYSKDEIMDMYLNRIPYGANIYGVEVASQTFFGKPAAQLTLAESAILASIPKAPTYYSPYGSNIYPKVNLSEEEIINKDIRTEQQLVDYIDKGLIGKTYTYGEGKDVRSIYVKGRVDFVLGRMLELKYITQADYDQAIKEATAIQFKPFREDIVAPHFVMYIRQILEEKYGKEAIEKGGLRITTTLDAKLQKFADKAVEARAQGNADKYGVTDEALVSLDPDTGEILAMVGSRDFWNDEIKGKNNMALASRLPGSSFKPIVYASAFLQGYAPSTVVYDVKTNFGGTYSPENYDGQFLGPISFRSALGGSRNIPAVKAAQLAGVSNVLDLARKMGLNLNQPDDWYGLSLALGAGEVRPLDMAVAYAVFANGGYKMDPVAILKVEDRSNNILEEYKAPAKKNLVLDPQVAYLVNNVLSDQSARPTEYWRNELTIPGRISAAKTGTSNKKKDNINYPFDTWTMGYTRHLVTAVWAGNADGTKLNMKADGLGAASPIWRAYMTDATKDMPNDDFDKPEGIKWVKIAKRSGKLPSEFTPESDVISAMFASFSVPTEQDDSYKVVEIDKVSGKLATEFTPEGSREKKGFYVHHDLLPDNAQWESAVRAWAQASGQDEQPPTEYDDVHTAENSDVKPQITITSPTSKATVSPPSVDVLVKLSSMGGMKKVEYYLDDVLADTAKSSPFTGLIPLPADVENGSTHTIKAIAYDDLYRSSQSTVSIKIGSDETPPIVSFAYPDDGATLTVGTNTGVQVDAHDPNGSIAKVQFYLDDKLQKEDVSTPFTWQFSPATAGAYTLKAVAYDHAKNSDTASIQVKAVEDSGEVVGDSQLLAPKASDDLTEGSQILLKAFVAEADRNGLENIIFLSKKAGSQPTEIAEVMPTKDMNSSAYSVIWDSPTAGTYDLYFKVVLSDGKIRFSKKVSVVVH